MKKLYVITGANGHLGNTLVRLLSRRHETVRGLVLPGETPEQFEGVTYLEGDVRNQESLRPLFEHTEDYAVLVIHTAGIVDISGELTPTMWDVNVGGTRNLLQLCSEYRVQRMVYVSSVHAIPERSPTSVLNEVTHFSPEEVTGGYAKTKAEATELVLEAAQNGLDAVVVHPSGILGPFDRSGNHLVQMVADYVRGRLPACVRGGYDFVDVRDVAEGCVAAALQGRRGECYILSNRHYEVKDVLQMVRKINGGRRLPTLPIWMAKAAAPLLKGIAKLRHERPLYTSYSLYTLNSNDHFSHEKATRELHYHPRDLSRTIADTVSWIRSGKAPLTA